MTDILQAIDVDKAKGIAEVMSTHGGWGVAVIFLILLFVMGLYIIKMQREHRKFREKIAETFETHRKENVTISREAVKGYSRVANKLASLGGAFNDLVNFLRYSGMKIEVKEQEESATIILGNGESLGDK